MSNQPSVTPLASRAGDRLPPYRTPEVKRVRLALEETLATNCKVWESTSNCFPDFEGATGPWQNGS